MKSKHGFSLTRRRLLQGLAATAAASALAQEQETPAPTDEKAGSDILRVPAWYYQHFDADFSLETPEENFGGWKKADLDFSRRHTALVVMHAWEAGQRFEEYPGWWRCVPYIPRSNTILRDVFPPLLEAVRAAGFPLFHVVGGGDYYKDLPGYQRAVELADAPPPALPRVASDPIRDRLNAFRRENVFQGLHNEADVRRGFAKLDFPSKARPAGDEGIAENGPQLFALCRERGINHLVYCGFAINWCLLLSPGGMAEMQQYGLMCSALRQATTAVENRESARGEWCKELALWRVALAFGFVFDVDDFVRALRA